MRKPTSLSGLQRDPLIRLSHLAKKSIAVKIIKMKFNIFYIKIKIVL